jgi:RecB family exonuclease
LPSPAREDAILSDRQREEADPVRVPISADRVLAQLHAFDLAVRSASRSIALSVPHSDLERSERETSSILVEAGAALGRPDAVRQAAIPDLASLARTSFGPARAETAAFREGHPVTEAEWLDRAAENGEVPPAWSEGSHLDLARILALQSRKDLGPADGVLGKVEPFPTVPGIDPEKPISASALQALLACPLRFLYQRILHWEEPVVPPATRELDPLSYGRLFHEVMEAFYAAQGVAFVSRKRPLAHWQGVAAGIAEALFTKSVSSYPLVGIGIEKKERARLAHDVAAFLEYDWSLALTRFVAVEKPFGADAPVKIEAGGTALHVRGYVDRVDVEGDHTLLRDLKTGSVHPRRGGEEGPTPTRDIQLGLYGMVARKLADSWGVPKRLQVAYAYARSGDERAFRSDYSILEKATKAWLDFAARVLSERAFPPTPCTESCTFCPFPPVCGTDVPARAAAAAQSGGAQGAVAEFFRLKQGVE